MYRSKAAKETRDTTLSGGMEIPNSSSTTASRIACAMESHAGRDPLDAPVISLVEAPGKTTWKQPTRRVWTSDIIAMQPIVWNGPLLPTIGGLPRPRE